MPCNRLNQSKSWVLNAFLSWDLHNWHINMHVINWKWQDGVGKMFVSVKLQALAQRAPEHTVSWVMATLDIPRIRQGSRWPSLVTDSVLSVIHRLSSSMAFAGFTWMLYLFFLLYIMQSHRVSRLMDGLLTGLLAGHDTGLRIPTTTNDVCKGRGEWKKEKG